MGFTKFLTSTGVISALHDKPNIEDGLDSATLKGKFDQSATDIKNYLNNTLISELEGSGAAGNIGISEIIGMTSENVQAALAELYAAIMALVVGDVPDNSLTTAKYIDSSVTTAKLADGSVTTPKIASKAVTEAKIGNGALALRHFPNRLITSEKIALAGVLPENTSGLQKSCTVVNRLVPPSQWSNVTNAARVTVDGVSDSDFVIARIVTTEPGSGYPNYTWDDVGKWGIYAAAVSANTVTLCCKVQPDKTPKVQLLIFSLA